MSFPISAHLHHRPYQVAATSDISLPHRKWGHLGTHYAPTHATAAYDAYRRFGGAGNLVGSGPGTCGVRFRFSCGLTLEVGFGAA